MSAHPELSAAFEHFALVEAPELESPMYADLAAGLNLNFDRYAYRYLRAGREVLRWGRDTARCRSRPKRSR